jgi:hypothetical protein
MTAIGTETKEFYLRDLLRFAAALVVCFVRKLAHELSVLNGTAARFDFLASVVADHLFGGSSESRRGQYCRGEQT